MGNTGNIGYALPCGTLKTAMVWLADTAILQTRHSVYTTAVTLCYNL
jgi:hypothetical protein